MRFLFHLKGGDIVKELSAEQVQVLKKLAEIEKGLPTGVSLTFAVDNLAETMDGAEGSEFVKNIHKLVASEYLAKHSEKETTNRVPFWLEFTREGREYCKHIS